MITVDDAYVDGVDEEVMNITTWLSNLECANPGSIVAAVIRSDGTGDIVVDGRPILSFEVKAFIV
jgi:hypothetical protein